MTTIHTAAPSWDGDVSQLADEDLWKRDRALADHIAAILAHYVSRTHTFRPATPTEQQRGGLDRWVRALVEVRNESERRRTHSQGTTAEQPLLTFERNHAMSNPTTINADELSPEQLDGLACIVCASTTSAQRPVAHHAGVQLFACVSHDTDPTTAERKETR